MPNNMIPKEATEHFKRQCEHKRLEVLCSLIKDGDKVLDVGCGTGTYTSNPLSYLPIDITAIDTDPKTIEYAEKKKTHSNINFIVASGESFESDVRYDLIICSHILEHVPEPLTLLTNMNRLLKDDGVLYVAIPNGFGWFEIQNFLPRMLWRTSWGRKLIKKMMGDSVKDTVNVDSQHIHFYTIGAIGRLLRSSGWRIIQINNDFLGGIVFDRILSRMPSLDKWNVDVADRIPPQLANSWIFICKKSY